MRNKFTLCICAVLCVTISGGLRARENSTALYKEGSALAMKGDIDGAIEIFKRAVEASPYYCLAHYGLGKAYLYKKGRTDDAVRHLRRSVELDKRLARGHFYLGMAYLLKRKYIAALHAFKRAYDADSDYTEALYNMAVIYDQLDMNYEAVYYYRRYYDLQRKEESDSFF